MGDKTIKIFLLRTKSLLFWLIFVSVFSGCGAALAAEQDRFETLELGADVVPGPSVILYLKIPEGRGIDGVKLFRSTAKMIPGRMDSVRYPIVELNLEMGPDGLKAVDSGVAHNITL